MEFVGQLIAIILIFTLLPITFAIVLAKRKSLKKYKAFKNFLEIDEAFRKLKRRDYSVGRDIEFPLLFNSAVTIIFTVIPFSMSLFFLICSLNGVQLDKSVSVEKDIIYCIVASLVSLLMAFFFIKQGRVIILSEKGIKTASHLRLIFRLGNFHYIEYSEIDSLKIRIIFGGGGLSSRSADCEIAIKSQKGDMTFSANPGYTNDVLMLIAALNEKLSDKIKIVHKSRRT